MDAATLADAMGNRAGVNYAALVDGCNQAMRLAGCTTVNRAAMFLAQCGAESGGLEYDTELADGSAYEGRRDLGNTQAGDGPRFKGRGFIQITGRANYQALSDWAESKHLVPSANYFTLVPTQLADPAYVWLGPVWYWGEPHSRDTTKWRYLNDAADARDIVGATYIVNGGQNGIEGRTERWQHCLSLGDKILPDLPVEAPAGTGHPITSTGGFMDTLTPAEQQEVLAAARSWTKRLAKIDALLYAVTNPNGYVQLTLKAAAKSLYALVTRKG